MQRNISSISCNIQDIKVTSIDSKNGKNSKPEKVTIYGKEFHATSRFWDSIFKLFIGTGVSHTLCQALGYENTLDMISKNKNVIKIDICVENDTTLYGAVIDGRSFVQFDDLVKIVTENGGANIRSHGGFITAVFEKDDKQFNIGPDAFINSFTLNASFDGTGSNSLSLGLKRLICLNGMTATSDLFRSGISSLSGDRENDYNAINRAVGSFSNDSGAFLLQQKVALMQNTRASIAEVHNMRKALSQVSKTAEAVFNARFMKDKIEQTVGLQYLPSEYTHYELGNLLTELATHKLEGRESLAVAGIFGSSLSRSYDLENATFQKKSDFQDLYLPAQELVFA